MIDHVISVSKQINKQQAYECYITNALMYIVNNTADQESRMLINTSYYDLINPATEQDIKDNKEKEKNIINNIKNKLNGGDTYERI